MTDILKDIYNRKISYMYIHVYDMNTSTANFFFSLKLQSPEAEILKQRGRAYTGEGIFITLDRNPLARQGKQCRHCMAHLRICVREKDRHWSSSKLPTSESQAENT